MSQQNSKQLILQNIIAALSVSFVALSLGAAFGLLSGRGAFVGMLSAAIIALVTSLLGGTRVQCSGPTGPMTAVTTVIVAFAHDHLLQQIPGANPDHFLTLVLLMAGGLMILMGVLRLGKFITYVPNVVISGFMNGIAIIIWLDQLRRLFGFGGKAAYEGNIWVNVIVVLASVVLVFGLPKLLSKWMPKYASLLSGTFLTIIIMTLVSSVLSLHIEHVHLTGTLHSFGDFTALIGSQWPSHISQALVVAGLPFAIQLAILAYLDTLLTSLVVDKMTGEKTKQNKELVAQGIANGIAGVIGGIPGAQATIRSVLIVKEKATSRIAGILVGVFALVEMILFQDAINLIPQAVFAGILIKVGYDVFDWKPVRLYVKEWARKRYAMVHNFFSRHDDEPIFVTHREFMIILGTTLVTAVIDLNLAVGAFTVLFYLHNKVFNKKNPLRDLVPMAETEGFADES